MDVLQEGELIDGGVAVVEKKVTSFGGRGVEGEGSEF